MPKRLAETQLTQDNADQYLDEEEDKEEVREVAAVLFGTLFFNLFPATPSLTEWSVLQSGPGGHEQENVSVRISCPLPILTQHP